MHWLPNILPVLRNQRNFWTQMSKEYMVELLVWIPGLIIILFCFYVGQSKTIGLVDALQDQISLYFCFIFFFFSIAVMMVL